MVRCQAEEACPGWVPTTELLPASLAGAGGGCGIPAGGAGGGRERGVSVCRWRQCSGGQGTAGQRRAGPVWYPQSVCDPAGASGDTKEICCSSHRSSTCAPLLPPPYCCLCRYQFKTHPNIDKALYANDSTLGLKDPSRPFPTGAPLGERARANSGRSGQRLSACGTGLSAETA